MSSLLKSPLDNSIANAVYNEIQNRSARYYYFLGKTLRWTDETNPPYPIDSFNYELNTRNEIITMKEVNSTDVAFVIPRKDWATGFVWDMYDDQYSTEVQGINLITGGYGYSSVPTITISGGGGTGASAVATLLNGSITAITLTSRGSGYTSTPSVVFSGGGGSSVTATAVVNIAYSGTQRLEDTNCYVLTDDYNVYKCLDNNNNAISTYKPIGTVVDPVIMPDGYMWKYLYSIPIALRNKFLTDVYMPVVNSIRSQFYSNGEILNIKIDNAGQNYTFANISVAGDGYRSADPLLLTSLSISNGGSNYTSGATLSIAPPFSGANTWTASVGILLGQKVEYNNNMYECTVSGTTATPAPTHKSGIVANGTAALKYIGTRATGTLTTTSNVVTGYVLNGQIYDITLGSGGLGYSSAPTVSLSNGFISVASSATTTITLSSAASLTAKQAVVFDKSFGNVVAGTTYYVYATTTSSTTFQISATSGGTVFTVGTGTSLSVTGTLTASGTNFVGSSIMNGTSVSRVYITNSGDNYTSVPQVTFGTQWLPSTAYTVGQQIFTSGRLYTVTVAGTTTTTAPTINGAIASIPVTSGGTGYTSSPTFTVSAPDVTGGTTAVIAATYSAGVITGITISSGGSGYINPPTITYTGGGGSGLVLGTPVLQTVTNGTATLVYAGIPATGTAVLKYGSGYSALPTVTINPVSSGSGATAYFVGTQSSAKLIPLISNGQITAVQIDNGGTGYTYANITVTGDGTSAALSADLSPGDINTLQANTELLTPDGRIMAYPVISGGYGYGSDFPVTITGDGTGAAATANIVNGRVNKITVTNYGLGYRWCKVAFDQGSGTGAAARGVMAPYGGHGKDPITGMFAKTLMFYSNISKDTNQGFTVNNDFRQLGVIKNPRQFGSYGNLANILASACYVVTGFIDTTNFTQDMSVNLGTASGPLFRIVALTSTGVLLQSLDNAEPVVGSVFINAAGNTFSASGVTAPTADKYSGNILFIDNKVAFTPTADQNVTMRTVIHF